MPELDRVLDLLEGDDAGIQAQDARDDLGLLDRELLCVRGAARVPAEVG